MNLLLYGFLALAILGTIGGIGYKVREAGADSIRVEWSAANTAAQKKAEDERQRQDALRAEQDKQATRRLADEKKRSGALMVSLEAHIKASGSAAQCPMPVSLRDDWNRANAGPEGERTGTVPSAGGKPSPAR